MWILLILIVLAALWVISMFNGLIALKNRVDEAASDIDVQLKRRHDLVPNLVNTVKGYATHEQQLFERVTEARSQAVSAGADMQARAQAENALSSTLRSLFAVAENYPELKANQNFLALQEELSDTENKVMASRRFYNSNVRDYNIRRETFPTNMLAEHFHFPKREQFELDDISERAVPEVNFAPETVQDHMQMGSMSDADQHETAASMEDATMDTHETEPGEQIATDEPETSSEENSERL